MTVEVDGIDYATLRERAFKEVAAHPENIDAISHNLAVAMMQLEVPATTWMSTMDELNRRWEHAKTQERRPR